MMNPAWLDAAYQDLGMLESPGRQHNMAIVRMWEAIKAPFRDDETPWCAAFVGAKLEQCGIRSTRSAAARSYLKWGIPVAVAPGVIAVFSRPGSSWSGHVGFVVGRNEAGNLLVLGGNQGNRVSVAPFAVDRLLDCRWPEEYFDRYAWRQLPTLHAGGELSRNEA
jgi:uncharacterized protein (TIGR02594 family)